MRHRIRLPVRESPPLRLDSSGINDTQKGAISCSRNGLRLVVSDEPEAGEVATGVDRSQPDSAAQAQIGAERAQFDAEPDAAYSSSVPTVDEVRSMVETCESLPEHIRAAVLALLSSACLES